MGRDLELLRLAEQGSPGARVYSWDGLWVTLGRFQNPDEALVKPVPYVVRPTGGRAVLHGHDVTVAVAIAHDLRQGSDRSVRDVYRTLVRPLAEALRACSLFARLGEETPHSNTGTLSADCFAFSSPNDVVDELTGSKVCGCALRISARAALLQASIPFREPSVPVEDVIAGGKTLPLTPWRAEEFAEAFRVALAFGPPLASLGEDASQS